MNLNPANWFWTQIMVVTVFLGIYVTMSLTPWYYDIGIKDNENKSLKAIILTQLNSPEDNEHGTDFEKKYINGGRLSSMDLMIVLGYAMSLTYTLGLFISSLKTSILVNIPPLILLIGKTFWITRVSDVYKWSLKNVIMWWICLLVYYVAFYIHDRVVITDIEYNK